MKLTLETDLAAGWPWSYELEGNVTDISRQQIAGRTSFRVDPAPWYIGVKTPPYFADAAKGVDTAIVAAALDGTATAGRQSRHRPPSHPVELRPRIDRPRFLQLDLGAQRARGGTFRRHHAAAPVPLHIPITDGGEYLIIATAKDAEGRSTTTRTWFYAVGARLHRVGTLRPQPHRSRAGEEDLEARRDRADHGQVAVGARHRAAHHRARRRAHVEDVRADLDADHRQRSDHREGHPQSLHLRAAAEGAHEGRRRGRERSRQARLPPRLHRDQRRRRHEAAEGRGESESRRVPSRVESAHRSRCARCRRQTGAVRGHVVGRRLRRAVADRLFDARRVAIDLPRESAAGRQRRLAPEDRQPPRADAERGDAAAAAADAMPDRA